MQNCPLCLSEKVTDYHQDKQRLYLACLNCFLVFVPATAHLSLEKEQAIYDLHQNDLLDEGYQKFLSRLTSSLQPYLKANSYGLDYGCGPAPLLARLLENAGQQMSVYDPFYAKNTSVLKHSYDFITCTEVVEHFREPQPEFKRLFGLLNPDGILAIMTKRVINQQAFSRWHYKNDPSHISFYSENTLLWLADQYRFKVDFPCSDVAIFKP